MVIGFDWKNGDVVYYFTIRKPGSQEKWKTGIMEKPCYGFRVTGCGSDPRQAHRAWRIEKALGSGLRYCNFKRGSSRLLKRWVRVL